MTREQADLLARCAELVRPLADLGDQDAELLLELLDAEIEEFWDGYEPTDTRPSSRPVYDLDGYDLGDPKRIALEMEMGQ